MCTLRCAIMLLCGKITVSCFQKSLCRSLTLLSLDSQDAGDALQVFVNQKSYLLVSYLPVCVYGSAELHHGPLGTLLSRTVVAPCASAIFLRLATLMMALAIASCPNWCYNACSCPCAVEVLISFTFVVRCVW